MVKIRAFIKLYENGRKTPFLSGYRPLFDFIGTMKTSGRIELIGSKEFHPGYEGVVEITFLNKEYLGDDFQVGKVFFFGESEIPLGEGIVNEIISNN